MGPGILAVKQNRGTHAGPDPVSPDPPIAAVASGTRWVFVASLLNAFLEFGDPNQRFGPLSLCVGVR